MVKGLWKIKWSKKIKQSIIESIGVKLTKVKHNWCCEGTGEGLIKWSKKIKQSIIESIELK